MQKKHLTSFVKIFALCFGIFELNGMANSITENDEMFVVVTETDFSQICDFDKYTKTISTMIKNSEEVSKMPQILRCFWGSDKPGIGPRAPRITPIQYIQRFMEHSGFTLECYFVAIIYMQRIALMCGMPHIINVFTFHRMFLAAMVVAQKFYGKYDKFYTHEFYAKIGGIPQEELGKLELNFIWLIQFNLYISENEWHMFIGQMQAQ